MHLRHCFILESHLPSTAARVVTAHRACLVETAPVGPVQHRLRWGQAAHHQVLDEATGCKHDERDQLVVSSRLCQEPP